MLQQPCNAECCNSAEVLPGLGVGRITTIATSRAVIWLRSRAVCSVVSSWLALAMEDNMALSTMLDAESQPVVALDEGHSHDDQQIGLPPPISIEEKTPPTLPVALGQLHKRPRLRFHESENHPPCKDKIKWIGDVMRI